MTVYCNNGFSADIARKGKIITTLNEGMIYYFQNMEFGDGVKEIVYQVKCGDSVFLFSFGAGTTYGKRNKSIGCGFTIDYEMVQALDNEKLYQYFIEQLIKETRQFAKYNIKKFDLEAFVKSLEGYFMEAIELIKAGKKPAEGKVLNEDIQSAMYKKFTKL